MKRSASFVLHTFLLCLTVSVIAFAQVPTGGVRGTIKDQSEAVIPGAKVTVKSKETGTERVFTTKSDGSYQVVNLAPGEYEVVVGKQGFKTGLSPVVIQVGDNVTVDFTLEIGQASETVVITSDTPAINTTDFKIDGVVNRQQIDNLPLNGRSFLQLAMLEPGVAVETTDNPGTSPNNFFRVSIAGASQALTRISVDGATVNDRVTGGTSQNFSQETVQEFQISSFNFDLSTSVTAVGSVNAVSRSGTNEFHGSAFIYYRDHQMAAFPALKRNPRRFIDTSLDDPFFARRQMGGSIGGPIKKDKLFFFFNYEHQNQDGVVSSAFAHPIWSQFDVSYPQPLTFNTPNLKINYTINEKNNAFIRLSGDRNNNFNAGGGGSLPSLWVVTKNRSGQALFGLSTVFTPTLVNDLRWSYGVYSGRLSTPTTEDCPDPIYCIGIGGDQYRSTLGGFEIGNHINAPQNRVLRTYQLTDTLSWQKGSHRVRVGGEWEHFYGQGHWAYLEPSITVLWDPLHILQFVLGTGGFPNSPFAPLYNSLPTSLKLNATGTGPLQPGLLPTLADIRQLPLFSFFMGIGDPGQPQPYNFDKASRNNRYRFFFADQWRIHPRFTLTYGLAYSFEDTLLNHDLDKPAILAPLLNGDLRPSPNDYNNFDPSIGFAWDVKGNGKTVIRGGGGIYHDSNLFWTRLNERGYIGPSGNGRSILPGSFFSVPGVGTLQFSSVPTNFRAQNLTNIFGNLKATALALLGNGKDLSVRGVERLKTIGEIGFGPIFDPGVVVPYSMNVSGGIQRELAPNLVVQADFVMRRSVKFSGLHGTAFYDRNQYNRAAITAVNPTTGRGSTAPNPIIPVCQGAQFLDPKAQCSLGAIGFTHGMANFRYTGLHVKLDKRFSNRYLFVASYALSKYTGFNGVINYNNLNEADGYQGADRTHRFVFSGFMELPSYSGDNGFIKAIFNTWKVGLISQMVSKPTQTTNIGVDIDGDGNSTFILPGSGTYRNFGRGLSKSQLRELVNQFNQTYPTAVTGKRTVRDQVIPTINLPADFDHGDTFISQDIRLTRMFRITERVNIEFIGEAFNIFNISNLTGFGGSLTSSEFGQATGRAGGVFGTGGPRAFQVAARLTF